MSRDFASLNFDFDYRSFERQLDDVAKKALPRAAAGFLNGVAFEARRNMIRHNGEAFDGYTKWTDRGWYVTKTKPTADPKDMHTEVKALPIQSGYLQFQIFGGVRKVGDSGSGPYDLFVHADKTNDAGNIQRGFLRRYRLSPRNRKEKKDRKVQAQKRVALRQAGKSTRPAMWVTKSKNKPGIFFGQIGGMRGYWERPQRTEATHPRRRGVVQVRLEGKPKRLLAVADQARYKPIFRYDDQVMKAWRAKGTQAQFAYELQRALRKR